MLQATAIIGALLACVPAFAAAGPYTITLNQSSVDMKIMPLVTLTVRKDGKLASDLLPYGGSSGLADFINTRTGVTYKGFINPLGTSVSSVAPTNVKATSAGPEMEISMPNMPADPYTLKVHIRGAGEKIYTASFTLDVR
jgi:hypothetical protein